MDGIGGAAAGAGVGLGAVGTALSCCTLDLMSLSSLCRGVHVVPTAAGASILLPAVRDAMSGLPIGT